MATDYAQMSANLRRFYDFTDKTVLFVGAAGRQLLDLSAGTRKLIAVDKDAAAIRELQSSIAERGLQDSMQAIAADFYDLNAEADVLYFEFCLHEMSDPQLALVHAKCLAPDVVVYDHSPDSEWIYFGAEEEKVAHSTRVMLQFGARRHEEFLAEQRFTSYDELLAKVAPQGLLAMERIQRFAGATDIIIPMGYQLNLL